jgi:hypothetical protein
MQIRLVVAVSALISAANAVAADPVLLASRRGGWIEAISLETLETVSRVRVPEMTNSVASDLPGQRLFLTAPSNHSKSCCALFALDPQSLQLSFLVQPALSAIITSSGLFTQRGSVGIEVFDVQSLQRLPVIKAPGVYRLRPSPDGRLLFGITNFPQPALDLFDAAQGLQIASQPLPRASHSAGAWLDRQFFLFILQQPGQAMLRSVSNGGQLGQAVPLSVSGSLPDCQEAPYDVIASAGKLVIYPQFGGKGDSNCTAPGGFMVADPATGAVMERFSSTRFNQMVASPDGRYLYGLEVGSPAWRQVKIVQIDSATGRVTAQKSLAPDVWYLTTGRIPQEMLGHMDLSARDPIAPMF